MNKVIVILVFFINLLFGQWKIGEPCADGYVLYPKIGYSITNGNIQQTDRGSTDADFEFETQTNFNIILPLTKLISFNYYTQNVKQHTPIYYDQYGDLTKDGGYGFRENQINWNKSRIGVSFNFYPSLFNKLY